MSQLNQYVLAAYYSDARLNVLACLNDIREKTGYKPIYDEAEILHAFKSLWPIDEAPEQQKHLVKYLRQRFYFIDVLFDPGAKKEKNQDEATVNPKHYYSTLLWVFTLLNELRNKTAHPADEELMIASQRHRKLFSPLIKFMMAVYRRLKHVFHWTAN